MMSSHPDPQDEWAAGYVLGDLTAEEAEQFQRWLEQDPLLQQRVTQLQETLGLMTYGLMEIESPPPLQLQPGPARKLSNPKLTHHFSIPNFSIPKWLFWKSGGSLALLGAIAFGTYQYPSRPQLQGQSGSIRQVPQSFIVQASTAFWNHQWLGIRSLHADHQRSLTRAEGEPPEQSPSLINPVSPLVSLKGTEAKLLGLTPCRIAKAKGVRMTYRVGQETVSLYQLKQAHAPDFPHPGSELVSLEVDDGLAMVLWERDSVLYAIVSELSVAQLQQLALQHREQPQRRQPV